MIIAVDTETQGLNARRFLMGSIVKTKGREEVFYSKEKMYKRIIELGEQERKRGKLLTVYAHNHLYDYIAYSNLHDKKNHFYSERPFIVTHIDNNKEVVKFLDSLSIFKMSLEEAGKILGYQKTITPEKLKQDTHQKYTKEEWEEIKEYMLQDTRKCYGS